MANIPGTPMRTARAELVVNAKTGDTPKNRYGVEVEIDGDHVFVFPRPIVTVSSPNKLPSTIRVLSDVCDAIIALGKVDERIRMHMQLSVENEPTELEAKSIVGMLGIAIEKLTNIQGDLTMGVKQ